MLDQIEAEALVSSLWYDWLGSRTKSEEWQEWALGKQPLPVIPDTANLEYRALQERAVTPWLGLLVQSLVQSMVVDGYRARAADEDNVLWSVWQANGMDAKQVGIYEAAVTTGVSYVAVLPTKMPGSRSVPSVDGQMPVPEWRPFSSAEMTAFYASPYDEWPLYAIAAEQRPKWSVPRGESPPWRVTLFDSTSVYILDHLGSAGSPRLIDARDHGMDVCPVIDYTNRQTITGRAIGEIEPYVSVAARIDQDVFDRLVVQRFGSWRVRTATGLVTPGTTEEVSKQELDLKVGDVLISDSPNTKFDSLAETPLDGHLRAPFDDVRMLAAVSQTPPQLLTADLVNVSAEALAAIEAGYNRKVEQRKTGFGESHEQAFALSAQIMGMEYDSSAEVQWRDMESRSMAQVADAFGKLATQLQIPVEVLWDKIGFLTEQDKSRARELRTSDDAMGALLRGLSDAQVPPAAGDAAA